MAERPVIVLGGGGHAKVVIDLLRKLGRDVLAAAEPGQKEARWLLGIPVENEDIISAHDPAEIELALGVGMPGEQPIAGLAARRALAARFEQRGYRFPALVHPAAIIGTQCEVAPGAQVMAGAVVQPGCSIGPFAIVNTGSRVDHDCILGEACHIAPGATLGGGVRIGRETLVGIGATVRQGISIGARVLIAGGAMVVSDVADGERQMGVPARGHST